MVNRSYSSASSASQDSFAYNNDHISAGRVTQSGVKITYGNYRIRMTRMFSEIGQNRAPVNEISGTHKAAALSATHRIVEAMRHVTVEGDHKGAKYVFQGNRSILNDYEGGAFIFENAIIVGYTDKRNAICGIILA